jgi:O-acetyl-ADP-ribose deacetylase (regulator of RNase III)
MHGTFQLEAQGDKTLVDYELDADVNVAIPGFMKQAGIANIVKATMQNLKARCER